MADVDHYQIAEQLIGESVQGAGTMSGRAVANARALSADRPLSRSEATHGSGARNGFAAPVGKTCHRSAVVTVSQQEPAPPGRRFRRSDRAPSAYQWALLMCTLAPRRY